jgi:hypothetical protein
MTQKPYFITEDSPDQLRKLLIRYPFLPELYENIRTGQPLHNSISALDRDDPVAEFVVIQLTKYNLVEVANNKLIVKHSRIVPPQQWKPEEHIPYIDHVLADLRDQVIKNSAKKRTFGNWVGSTTTEEFLSFGEKQIASGDSLTEKPDGPVKFQYTFILTEI